MYFDKFEIIQSFNYLGKTTDGDGSNKGEIKRCQLGKAATFKLTKI